MPRTTHQIKMTAALTVTLMASFPVAAQVVPQDAFPLAVGNRWEFWDFGATDTAVRWEVVGEQTVGSETVALLAIDGNAPCAVRTVAVTGGYVFKLVSPANLNAPCASGQPGTTFPAYHPPESLGPAVTGPPNMGTVTISGTPVTGGRWYGSINYAGPGFPTTDSYDFIAGVGPWGFGRYRSGGGPGSSLYGYTLQYARINGVDIGQPAIPTGPTALQGYFPHAVGDQWQYRTFGLNGTGGEGPTGFVVWTVTATGAPTDRPLTFTIDVLRRPLSGPDGRWTCTVAETAFSSRTEYRVFGGPSADCGAMFPTYGGEDLVFGLPGEFGAGPVNVGGQSYTLDRVLGRLGTFSNGGPAAEWSAEGARGLGLYRWERRFLQTPSSLTRGVLGYARVGGVEYGSALVTGEEPISDTAPFALSVDPNPARSHATVRYSLAETGLVRVVILDALGREVAVVLDGEASAGERAVPVDTSRWPAGIYVVRVEAGGGVSSARLVVAR